MIGKQRLVARKFQTYEGEVTKYHQTFRNADRMPCPTLADVRSLNLEDNFWDIDELTHPAEPWAIDPDTKVGIRAFLTVRSCEEELRRIAREVRQMIQSSLMMATKIDSLHALSTVCKSLLFLFMYSRDIIDVLFFKLGLLNVTRVQHRLI